MTRYELTKEIK